jgi:hypothetical protein
MYIIDTSLKVKLYEPGIMVKKMILEKKRNNDFILF